MITRIPLAHILSVASEERWANSKNDKLRGIDDDKLRGMEEFSQQFNRLGTMLCMENRNGSKSGSSSGKGSDSETGTSGGDLLNQNGNRGGPTCSSIQGNSEARDRGTGPAAGDEGAAPNYLSDIFKDRNRSTVIDIIVRFQLLLAEQYSSDSYKLPCSYWIEFILAELHRLAHVAKTVSTLSCSISVGLLV